MRGAVRWAVALAAAAVAAGLVGCGGGEDEAAVSVPEAPGAPLTERVLAADELGIAGFTGAGGDVEAREPADLLAGECAQERARSLEVLDANGVQAVARRGFTAGEGGGVSIVWQFSTPAGAAAWQEEVIRQSEDPVPECQPDDVTRTGFETTPVRRPSQRHGDAHHPDVLGRGGRGLERPVHRRALRERRGGRGSSRDGHRADGGRCRHPPVGAAGGVISRRGPGPPRS